jgi:hypothetical protein
LFEPTARRKRARPGDILEVKLPDGLAYLHYVGKHPDYGDAIVVSPTKHQTRPGATDHLFDDGYVTFYPVTAAVHQGFVTVIGHAKVPPHVPPTRFRRPGVYSERGVETWVIEDETGDQVRTKLSDAERLLPIAAIWNHEFLLGRIDSGWRPESEG